MKTTLADILIGLITVAALDAVGGDHDAEIEHFIASVREHEKINAPGGSA